MRVLSGEVMAASAPRPAPQAEAGAAREWEEEERNNNNKKPPVFVSVVQGDLAWKGTLRRSNRPADCLQGLDSRVCSPSAMQSGRRTRKDELSFPLSLLHRPFLAWGRCPL